MESRSDILNPNQGEVCLTKGIIPDFYSPKVDLSPLNGKITELRVSKSLIRQLLYKGTPYPACPSKVLHTLLLRDVISPPTDSQIKGLYFESKCLGATADGNYVEDLPRHKKTGDKLADHERIDQAINLFSRVKEEYGLLVTPNRIQLYHKRRWKDPSCEWDILIYLDGILDLISPIRNCRYSFPEAVIDLKLTRDRDVVETYSNGLFHSTPWGNMAQADFTEAMMYRLIFGRPFVYLVFDYRKENPGYRDIPIITDVTDPDQEKASKATERMIDLYKTLRWVIITIKQWESDGWPMSPIPKVCNSCPIGDCPKRDSSEEI